MRIRRRLSPVFATCLVLCAGPLRSAELHVDAACGDDALDGSSWGRAKETLRAALVAASATPEADTIRVAEGRHLGTFVVPPGVTLEGGYPSGGGERNWKLHRTILDGRGAGPVVTLGPGTDASGVDGFVIRGGRTSSLVDGGGLTVRGTSARVSSCLIEQNEAPQGGGVLVDMRGGMAEPLIERCVIRANVARLPGGDGQGGGVLVLADDDGHFDHPVLHHGRVIGNRAIVQEGSRAIAAGGVLVRGCARLEHVHVLGNEPAGVVLDGAPGHGSELVNTEVSGSGSHGIVVGCGTTVLLDNCTFAENAGAAAFGASLRDGTSGATWAADVTRSILWSNATRGLLGAGDCALSGESVADSIVEGGHAGGQNVLDADPLWLRGPAMDHYLSSVAAGQAADSPALDAGPALAVELALESFTTRVDSGLDEGAADWGAHCEPMDPSDMILEKGTTPAFLVGYREVLEMPMYEAPLRTPSPAVYFNITGTWNDIRLSKNEAADVLVISW